MYFYIYKEIIYSLDSPLKIEDFKKYILAKTFSKKNYFIENIKVSYDCQYETNIPNDTDILMPYILYNISIVPIKCEKHLN
tara:strand:+ start:120 stop:362 length:243 start_codon:yes stop_codon:yes gene_type:complete